MSQQEPVALTFMDHLHELKNRFFWVAILFVIASGVAFAYYEPIIKILTLPLGSTKLYYLTPAGGLSFVFKVCMYVGVIAILPAIIYHLYKFIAPVMKKDNARAVLGYTAASTILALLGIAFAYFISLPAALHFLTSIELGQISSMLTIDAYMSFTVAYIMAGAALFQLPLIMMIVNGVTPLPPKKLMSYQRYMIVGAFIIAAVISPTPDVINQTILAVPMIATYQIGIILVWLRQRSLKKRGKLAAKTAQVVEQKARPEPIKTVQQGLQPAMAVVQSSKPGGVLDIRPGTVQTARRTPSVSAQRPLPTLKRSFDGVQRRPMPTNVTVKLSKPVVASPVAITIPVSTPKPSFRVSDMIARPTQPVKLMISPKKVVSPATVAKPIKPLSPMLGRSVDGFMVRRVSSV